MICPGQYERYFCNGIEEFGACRVGMATAKVIEYRDSYRGRSLDKLLSTFSVS